MKFIVKKENGNHITNAVEKYYKFLCAKYGYDVEVETTIRDMAMDCSCAFGTMYTYIEKLKWGGFIEILETSKRGRKVLSRKKHKKDGDVNDIEYWIIRAANAENKLRRLIKAFKQGLSEADKE